MDLASKSRSVGVRYPELERSRRIALGPRARSHIGLEWTRCRTLGGRLYITPTDADDRAAIAALTEADPCRAFCPNPLHPGQAWAGASLFGSDQRDGGLT